MLASLTAAAIAAGAILLLAGSWPLAWWSGVWFRARGAARGSFAYGFEGQTLDRVICAGLAAAPWVPVAIAALSIVSWEVAGGSWSLQFVACFGAVALAHGNYMGLGDLPSGPKPEPPMSWILGKERPGLDEKGRTRHQTKGAAIRTALLAAGPALALAAILAASFNPFDWLVLRLAVALLYAIGVLGLALALAYWVARVGARARLDPAYAARLKRRLRVDRWSDEQGMRPGWELMEFLAGAYAGALSTFYAAASLAILALRAWG